MRHGSTRTEAAAALVFLALSLASPAWGAAPGEVPNVTLTGDTLSWDAVAGATHYLVFRESTSALPGPAPCAQLVSDEVNWNDRSGVAWGDTFFYLVAGLNADGLGTLGQGQGAPVRQPGAICDSDGDGLDDVFEVTSGLDPEARDTDGDDLADDVELARGTDPTLADTDGDGVLDSFDPHPTNPGLQEDPFAIYLKSGAFIPLPGKDPALGGIATPDAFVFVQLTQGPSDQTIPDLEAQFGAEFFDYLPELTWYARVPSSQLDAMAADARVRWVGAIQPLHRVDPQLANEGFTAGAGNPDGTVTWAIHSRTDVPPAQLEADFVALGATRVDSTDSASGDFDVDMPAAALAALAASEDVIFLEQGRVEAEPYGAAERIAVGVDANTSYPVSTPILAETGSGVVVMLQEANQISGGMPDDVHAEFTGRVTLNPTVIVRSNHATHVAGIIAADGGFDGSCTACEPQATGMAPEAGIVAYYAPLKRSDARHDLDHAFTTYGARATNNSYGNPFIGAGKYGSIPQAFDERVQGDASGTRMIAVFSAGNGRNPPPTIFPKNLPHCDRPIAGSEFDCIGSPGTAKNVITVGSVHGGTLTPSSFSAFGPTDDGRLKPELVAPGEFVFSPIRVSSSCDVPGPSVCNGDCMDTVASSSSSGCTCGVATTNCNTDTIPGYGNLSGTSMAAPVVTGAAALLLQAWSDLGITGAFGEPLPSTIKAVLIHTATDLDNTGATGAITPRDGPSFGTGYGLVNVNAARQLLAAHAREPQIFEWGGITSTGMTKQFTFTLLPSDLGKPFHVTLVWDDFAPTSSTAKTLVNDFDLEVTAPDGTTIYHPWILDPAHPASGPNCFVTDLNGTIDAYTPCTDSDAGGATLTDTRNVVEQVFVGSATQAGVWTARVIGRSILKRSGFTPRFSLIIPFDHDVECGDLLTVDTTLTGDLPPCAGTNGLTLAADAIVLDCDGWSLTGDGYNMGVVVDDRTQVTVRNCLIQNFSAGIKGANVENSSFLDNVLLDNEVHIYLDDSRTNQIQGNQMRGGSGDGLWMAGPGNNVQGNTVENVGMRALMIPYASVSAPVTTSSANYVLSNRSWWSGSGAQLEGETTSLGTNSFCYSTDYALNLYDSASATFVHDNLLCHSGLLDIGLTFVGNVADVQHPSSDNNACDTYATDGLGNPWADSGETAGCTSNCASSACSAEAVPPAVDGDWDFVDPNDMVFLGAGVDPEGLVNLSGGYVSLGPGVIVNTQPPGSELLARRHFDDSQLGNLRRVGTRLYRKAPGSNTWTPQVLGSVAGLRGSVSDEVIGDGSTYRAFAKTCDRTITQLSQPQNDQVLGALQPGESLCLLPGALYTNVALDLDVPGVTLDCRGARLAGPGATCVDVHDTGGVTVVDCTFLGCATALSFSNAPDAKAKLNRVQGGTVGISVQASPRAAVAANAICGPVATPLDLDASAATGLNTCDQGCEIPCASSQP